MFENVQTAAPDSILGLSEAYTADPRKTKVNLTVGVYKNESLQTPILESVKSAERNLIDSESTKSYLGIDGLPGFTKSVHELVFAEGIGHDRTAVLQTPGGTGALRVGAEVIARNFPGSRIFVSTPTWANHQAIFAAAGLEIENYPYLDATKTKLDFEAMIETLESKSRPGDLVCLHACCHNPTGVDPTSEQWQQIADLVSKKQLVPFFDFAYQGFGTGLEADAEGLRTVLPTVDDAVVCSSFSKNFGLYSERVGAVSFMTKDANASAAILSQLKLTVRCNYSNPPRHGAAIVAEILGNPPLRQEWTAELDAMRSRIQEMRTLFADGLAKTCPNHDFEFLRNQNGMFSFTGLNPMQADWLKTERGVYMVGTGRVNVAGMSKDTMAYLCESIAECLAQS
jgi:aspartate aminotransferase/aromatic-amino-acid transaminase